MPGKAQEMRDDLHLADEEILYFPSCEMARHHHGQKSWRCKQAMYDQQNSRMFSVVRAQGMLKAEEMSGGEPEKKIGVRVSGV